MSTVTLPRADIPIAGDDAPTRDWYRWARDVTARVGGVTGSGTTDLAVSAFEDAGVPEMQADLFRVSDALNQLPPVELVMLGMMADNQRLSAEVEELRGLVLELYKAVNGIKQGTLQ